MELSLLFSFALTGLMAGAFYYDLTRYVIPNWLNLAILLLYPIFALMAEPSPDYMVALEGLGIVFGVGYVLWALKMMGAGDIKLLSALALWCGFTQLLLTLLIYTAVLGGALALFIYFFRLFWPAVLARYKSDATIPRLLTQGEPIPYGLAISVAFLILVWSDKIAGLGAGQ